MPDDMELGAVPAAESAGYGEAVTDEEFEEWVKRSQADTDATIADWDNSVHFDQIRSMVPPPLEVEPIEAEILNEDGTVATAEEVRESRLEAERERVGYASMAERIRAGMDIGPEARARVLGEMTPGRPQQQATFHAMPEVEIEVFAQCDDPACDCRRIRSSSPPPWIMEAMLGVGSGFSQMLADEAKSIRAAAFARRNLEGMGFVVVDDAAGPRPSGLALPHDDAVAWAKREFGVIPPADIAPGFTWTRG